MADLPPYPDSNGDTGVFQFFQLLPSLTIAENVALPEDTVRSKRLGGSN